MDFSMVLPPLPHADLRVAEHAGALIDRGLLRTGAHETRQPGCSFEQQPDQRQLFLQTDDN